MKPNLGGRALHGFTLIELMSALLILSLLALMSFRGLAAVLDARDQVRQETGKWKNIAAFLARFERDVQLSAPLPVTARPDRFEFSRFATAEDIDAPRRVAYQLSANREIELWLWPGFDAAPNAQPAHYVALSSVARMQLQYLDDNMVWVDTWPPSGSHLPLPRAVKLRIVLASGEALVRVFALGS